MKWLLLSTIRTLADLLVLVVSCAFLFGDFISVLLGHNGPISPIFVFIGGLVFDGETICTVCEVGLSIIQVLRSGRILF